MLHLTADLQCRDSFQAKPVLRPALAALGLVLLTASGGSAAPALTEFALPNSNSNPNDITTGPDGALWFTEEGAFDMNRNPLGPSKIGRITTGGAITEFATPAANSDPRGITVGPDGNLWFAETLGNNIGRITTAGVITEFPVPTANSAPNGIAAGPDGNIWFTEQGGNKIGRITTSGTVTEFPIPTSGSSPQGITAGPDGNIWFAEAAGRKIGRITTSGTVTEFVMSSNGSISSMENNIVAGPDGALWFATGCNQIGTITTSGAITLFPAIDYNCPLMAGAHAQSITVGTDGSLWLVVSLPFGFGSTISGYTTAGASNGIPGLSTFSSNGRGAYVNVPTAGPDGALWFTDFSAGKIGRYGPLPSTNLLVSAVLPLSRSVQVGNPATAFATIINAGTSPALGCAIVPATNVPASYLYQTTNPATNALTGTPNAPVSIAAGKSQSFVLAFTPTAAFAPTDVNFGFDCASMGAAAPVTGLNTLLLSASTTPVPDIIVESATTTNDGILHITGGTGSAAFATATINLGSSASITVTADTGGVTLPLAITLCQTNPGSGQCLATPSASVATTINTSATPTFAIFATASNTIPFAPATSRIFVRFADTGGAIRGSTSVAVETQ
jgi:virginiamycin B lyase